VTEAEFWLLDVAVELIPSLSMAGSPNAPVQFNRRSHGLTSDALVRTVRSLHERGWIAFGDEFPVRRELTERQLHAALVGRAEGLTLYWLTSKGGAAWEAVTAPDWQRYLDGSWLDPDEHLITVAGMDRERVARELHWPSGAFERIEREIAAERWEHLAPWQATYWKSLPHGHRVQATYLERRLPSRRCSEYVEAMRQGQLEGAEREAFRAWHRLPLAR
jgi:hypothetical protein